MSADALLMLPVLVPLAGAALSLLLRGSLAAQRALGVAGGAGMLAAGLALFVAVEREGVLATQLGAWPAPFGISFACDLLGASMVAVTGLVALATALYSLGSIDAGRERRGYWPLLHALLSGVAGSFLTGDLFNLYVWFEVMLMASFALMALGGERAQLEGAVKYLVLSLISSTLFLTAVGLLYGATGALNMAELSLRIPQLPGRLQDALAMLLLAAFGLKAAVFPLFAWLPSSYHTPPAAVSAVFAGLLTKVGVYALIRTFTLLFPLEGRLAAPALATIAGLSMVTGVLGAAAQGHVRRVLSFHIVSQIGYMVLGLAWATPLALAAAVFYLVHHIVTKTNLFLVAGVVRAVRGTEELARLGGLMGARPLLAGLFLVPALSLAGIPPLSGFWAKLLIFQAGLELESYVLVGVAAAVGLLTIYSMTKIWSEAFWGARPEPAHEAGPEPPAERSPGWLYAPIAGLALVTVALGIGAGPAFELARRAGEQLADPSGYVATVLREAGPR